MANHASQQPADAPLLVVPVMSPKLPTAESLLPYLQRIDVSRIYSNFGPLVHELEVRLGRLLMVPAGGLTLASSGTAALVGAVLASVGRATAGRPLALMPGYTFVATAVAAEQCGFRPFLSDVDPETWMLDPVRLLGDTRLEEVGVVIPVAPYGIAVPQAPWRDFHARTGIPVVIDGAASFEAICADPAMYLGDVPVVMSFHATKSFASGEGGAVVCEDTLLVGRAIQALNFGFYGSRHSRAPSINGKLSEYHAAVGLAELDGWEAKSTAFAQAAALYRRKFAEADLDDRLLVAPDVCSSYVLFRCRNVEESARVQRRLQDDGIEFRLWYGTGLHRHEHFADCRRDDLSVTERIAPCILGLPMAIDLGEAIVDRVLAQLVEALAEG